MTAKSTLYLNRADVMDMFPGKKGLGALVFGVFEEVKVHFCWCNHNFNNPFIIRILLVTEKLTGGAGSGHT